MPGDEIEAFTEGAKAAGKIADLGSKGLDVSRDAGGWLNRIFGSGIEDAVALHWSDRIKARRIEAAIYDWERLTTLARKVDARLNGKGVSSLRTVPPKIALALIEGATVEYDDDLHTLWANLLASGLDAAADEIQKKYISILSDLTGNDAKLLASMYDAMRQRRDDKVYFSPALFFGEFQDGPPYDEVPIITLARLGLVAPEVQQFEISEPNPRGEYFRERQTVRAPGDIDSVQFTQLGEAFCKAVMFD